MRMRVGESEGECMCEDVCVKARAWECVCECISV